MGGQVTDDNLGPFKHRTHAQRFTIQTLLTAHEAGVETYGAAITKVTGLPSGTVHPILARLQKEGWVESRVEDIEPRAGGRPRRRYYRLTDQGAQAARAWLGRT